jgi:nucleotide-binding universal stress UspA family protein
MEIKKILFPTDFSRAANQALPHALKIAQKYEADINVLHVATPYSDDPNVPEYQQLDEGNFKEYIEKSMGEIYQAVESSQKVTTEVVREVAPATGILDFIEEKGIDLTVMGTHGHSALAHFFLGSVAERVVRHAPCPVLTVAQDRKEYWNNPDYQNIVVAFDFSEHSKKAAREARDIATQYGARLEALYVVEQEVHPAFYLKWRESIARELPQIAEQAQESLRSTLGEEGFQDLDVHVKIGDGKAHAEISKFARANQVDLIVMGTHGLSGLDRMLLGSTTERVVRIASCPVLTFKLDESEPA